MLLCSDLTTPEWDPNEDELEKQTLRELGGADMGNRMKSSVFNWTPWLYIFATLWRIERLLADSRAGNDAQVNSLPSHAHGYENNRIILPPKSCVPRTVWRW